ncbi:MAG: MopE-related protein [Candidatus Nanoarchaeia archaeon]
MKKSTKKKIYITCIVFLLVLLVFMSSSCSKKRDKYCRPPKTILGNCHTACGSPAECHLAYPGDKGPDCNFGQVCNDKCTCEWVDKDLDGYPSHNIGYLRYTLDCDDKDPTVFPGAPEICDGKDNDCEKKEGNDIDEGGVCNKNVYFCSSNNFDNNAETCNDGLWCTANTINTSAYCNYTTKVEDIGDNDVYVFVCDNFFDDGDYGCYKFIKGGFKVLIPCNNNNIIDPGEECDGANLGVHSCEEFGYTGGTLKCDKCTFDFDECEGVVCDADGVKDPGEECDGNDFGGKTCESLGLGTGKLLCTNQCKLDKSGCSNAPTCGNGVINVGEQCDGSNWGPITGCSDFDACTGGVLKCGANCKFDTSGCTGCTSGYCGDGVVNTGETCDGTNFDGKTCFSFDNFKGGNLICDPDCQINTQGCYGCGDGIIQSGEECDGTNWGAISGCTNLDQFSGGNLRCASNCKFDTSDCIGSEGVCGNGVIDSGETCDGSNLSGKTCFSFGFTSGNLVCDSTCHYDTSGCYKCGDNVINPGEQCDGTNFGPVITNCSSFDNFTGGTLRCGSNCLFDTSSCIGEPGICGDGIINPGETCDGLNLDGKTCSTFDSFVGGTLTCDNCQFNTSRCTTQCTSAWSCTAWTNCSKMTDNQSRSCIDTNNCGSPYTEERPCVYTCIDADGDGYCACLGPSLSCDCDDSNAAVHPDVDEICNGRDDNCDATIDEGCPCITGDNRTCGVNVGLCREGVQRCVNALWGICGGPGYIGPRPEVCDNGLDENCNGYPDEGCTCEENQTMECESDVGECEKGTMVCFEGNWSACSGYKGPVPEVCNGSKDEDCDGLVDCDDASCSSSSFCTGTTTTGATPTCYDGIKNQGETGVDCGGPCPACTAKTCGFGQITQACVCEGVERTSGYCCDGVYSIDEPCSKTCTDSDSDSLCDADEISRGTDPNNQDTDGDGVRDNVDDMPLCNQDGKCDSDRLYPEDELNCPDDCAKKKVSWLWWIIILLLIMIVLGLVFYMMVKKGMIKLKGGKKKEEQPKIALTRPIMKPLQPLTAAKKTRDISKLVDYLDKALKRNESRVKLKEASLKSGWTAEEVARAFDTIDKSKKQQVDKKFFSLFKK